MITTARQARRNLTVAGSDEAWLMSIVQMAQDTYAVTVVETEQPVSSLMHSSVRPECAVVALSQHDSAMDVRDLLERAPETRFVFVAEVMPLRPAVARVIRERGHAVISRGEPPFVVAATAAALMAESEPAP